MYMYWVDNKFLIYQNKVDLNILFFICDYIEYKFWQPFVVNTNSRTSLFSHHLVLISI